MGLLKRLTTLTIALIALSAIGFCYRVVKCKAKAVYLIFEDRFTEPFEVCYLLTNDKTLYKVTSHNERRISFRMSDITRALEKNGHEISDIILIIHNHMPGTSRYFSTTDIQTWYDFKAMGFTGNYYLLYQTGVGHIIYELLEDEKKEKK